jgi:RND family efflux transporter MFP subunit
MKLKLLAIVLLLVAGGAAVYLSLGGSLPLGTTAAATAWLTAAATTGDVTDEVAATGTIATTETWAVGFGATPQVVTDTVPSVGDGTWTVDEVAVAAGQAVRAGDVLATASTADLERQLTMASSSLRVAKLQETIAEEALDDASGTDARRQARIGYLNAVNQRRQAEQDVGDIQSQLAQAVLTSPIGGIVTAVSVTPGLDATGTAFTIASATYEVTADVVESDISAMSMGQEATITVDAIGATIGGTVSAISSAGTGSSGVVTFPVTVTLTGAPSALRAGMTADITIVTASATDVLTVPAEALRGTDGNYTVRVLGEDGTPVATPVEVGLVTNALAEITSGLAEGDVVVTGTASDLLASEDTGSGRFGPGGGGIVVEGGPGPNVRP